MERDGDLIREILFPLEQKPADKDWLTDTDFPEDRRKAVAYHVELLQEAGFVEAAIRPSTDVLFRAEGLTWEGHDFLDAIRDDTVWTRTKETLRSKGLSFAFDLVKFVAISITKDQLS
jgi:hypothetical protein